MATEDFVPGPDASFDNWLSNFAAKCEVYETETGLTAQQILSIQAAAAAFSTKYTDVEETKQILKGQVASKDLTRKTSTANARGLAKIIKAVPGIDPAILGDLGILSSSSTTPVVPVTFLNVTGCDDGMNKITWNRNGNSQGTTFVIESRLENSTVWNFVAAVTKTSYNQENQVPGLKQYYRVKSARAGVTSNPSAVAVVYANGNESTLTLAA